MEEEEDEEWKSGRVRWRVRGRDRRVMEEEERVGWTNRGGEEERGGEEVEEEEEVEDE